MPTNPSGAGDRDYASVNQQWFSMLSKAEFVEGSPHLNHPQLRYLCFKLAQEALQKISSEQNPPLVLDMGAGDGALTVPYLELGAKVTAADVTVGFLQSLKQRSRAYHESLTVIPGDIFETLRELSANGQQFDLVCASSFLHHIPDYLELCRLACRLVRKGGIFFTFQDPLRYDTVGRLDRMTERAGYFWWRCFQGNYLRGINTRFRRLFGVYRPDLPEDSAEYHVVRSGIDEVAVQKLLTSEGFECEIRPYWSTHSLFFQHLGEKLKLVSNFAVLAKKTVATKNSA